MSRSIASRIDEARNRVEAACRRSDRDPSTVRIVAVSKRHSTRSILAAADAGITTFGESYVQELVEKRERLGDRPEGCNWHFIGHLQRNKVRALLPKISMIESVDSERLARRIDREAAAIGRRIPILLQVNTSNEHSKFGCQPGGAAQIAEHIAAMEHLELRGLMTMARDSEDVEIVRRSFVLLRELRDMIATSVDADLSELSMGMSGDFETAIEEGSTLVRLGTSLFGPRESA